MRLARFRDSGGIHTGVVLDDTVVGLDVAASDLPSNVLALLAAGPSALQRAAQAAAQGAALAARPLAGVTLLAPIPHPPKFLAIGLNYADHIAEVGREPPEFPVFFNKQITCVNDPFGDIHKPRASQMLDYEGELGVVIGRRCRHVPAHRASEVIAGFLVVNDVTARDWQGRSPTMTLGKSFDTHGPIGPWMVTPDEIEDPHDLRIRTWVNGDLRQDAGTEEMLFDCHQQIETLSTVCTLEPGDLIATGTPAGVGIARGSDSLLDVGDVVRIEIEDIGHIENCVIEEPDDTALVE